ncbi:MAG: histidine phosphatase family protein [Pseudomonadota bacterium]
MRNLVIIRHARASFDSPSGRDADRPLSASGHEEARAQGSWLASKALKPDRVLCSPAARTCETADAMGLPITHRLDAIYEASPGELVQLVETHGDADVVVLIGHNPGVSGLAAFLSGQQVVLSPGTIVEIAWESPVQAPLPLGSGHVKHFRHAGQDA